MEQEDFDMNEKVNILSYKQVGNKNSNITLVFLHGSTMTKEGMLPFAERFDNWNCIVFDLTAHGSSAGEEPKEIAKFAEDVENTVEYLQQEGVIGKKIVLLGYSMGGTITCEIALRKKMKLEGIIFLSSGADLKHHTPAIEELKNKGVEQYSTTEILDYLFGTEAKEEEKIAIKEMFESTKVSDIIGYGDLMLSNSYDRLEACKEIDVATLLVHGSDDIIVLPTAAIETWKVIPNSGILLLPYKGHAAIMEDGAIVKTKIESFLRKLV